MSLTSIRRRFPAGLATVVASLAVAAVAHANPVVNGSAITSPSDPYFVLDQGQTPREFLQGLVMLGTAGRIRARAAT